MKPTDSQPQRPNGLSDKAWAATLEWLNSPEQSEPSLTPEQEAESDELFPPGPLSPQAVEAVRSGKLPAVFAELFPEQFPEQFPPKS